MEKNKINLDNYFEQARNSKTDFDMSDARNLIENTAGGIAEPSKSIANKIGNYVMNILSFTAAAAAIGVMSLGFFATEDPASDIAKDEPIKKEKNYEALPVPDKVKKQNEIPEKDDKVITFNGKTDNDKTNTEKIERFEVKSQQPTWSPKPEEKVDVRGINVVELDQNALNNLGVKFENGNIVTWLFGPERPQRAVVSKREVDLELKPELAENIPNIWPKMITDAQGNKLLMAFQDDNATVTKTISDNKRMQFVNQNGQKINLTNAQANTYVTRFDSSDGKDTDIKQNMVISMFADVDSSFSFDKQIILDKIEEKQQQQQNLFKDDEKKDENVKMIIMSKTDKTNDTLFATDKLVDGEDEFNKSIDPKTFMQLIPKNKELNSVQDQKLMNLLMNDSLNDIDLNSEKYKIMIESMKNHDIVLDVEKLLSNKVILDSINRNLNIKIIDTLKTLLNNAKISIPKIKLMNPLGYDFDKYIRINKLIPIKINLPDAENTEMIFWYDATEELLDILPEDIAANIAPEFQAAEESDEFCEAPKTGGEKYFDIWRSCSGALENLTVYPNPTNGPINVKFILKEERYLKISLHDLNGNLVNDLNEWQKHGIGEINLNLSPNHRIESGMYLVVVRTDKDEQVVQRVIIE